MTDEQVFKDVTDMDVQPSLFQAWVGEGDNNKYVVIHDGERSISATVPEARALHKWLGEVLP